MKSLLLVVLLCLILLSVGISIAQDVEAATTPEAVSLISEGDYDILNFLLLGSDTNNRNNSGRTDVILIVSVNRSAGTVSLLSLPRDLYVYIPGWRLHRINTAYGYGESSGYDGGGAQLLADTIEYNLGIHIDYHARVDFEEFKQIIDAVGGVELTVDCTIQDWRLREPDLDPADEDNWEIFTLDAGVHNMDGDLALWYVRSRRTSSDFDRGRRQQDMMRALWRRILELNLLDQLPDIWGQVTEMVETDVTLEDMVELIPLALTIDTSRIAAFTFRPNIEVTFGTSPDGFNVLVPVHPAVEELVGQIMLPPTERQLVQEHTTIEVVNGSGVAGLEQVAADRLAWEGFVPQVVEERSDYRNYTVIYDYTGQTKGSSIEVLQTILRVSDEGVVLEPDPNREVDFRVVLGGMYYSCTHGVMLPNPELETPEA